MTRRRARKVRKPRAFAPSWQCADEIPLAVVAKGGMAIIAYQAVELGYAIKLHRWLTRYIAWARQQREGK